MHFDLPHPPAGRHQLADPRVEEVLQQGRPRRFEVEPGIFGDGALDRDGNLVGARGRLDHAWRMRDPQGAQRAGAVIAVVEEQPLAHLNAAQEVRAEAGHQADDACDRAEALVVVDLLGAQQYRLVEAKVGGLAAEHIAARADFADLDGRIGRFKREAEAKKRVGIGLRPEPVFDRLDEVVRDMPLADDQLVELGHSETGRQGVETAAVVRVRLDLRRQPGEARLQLAVGSLVGDARFALFELLVVIVGRAPLVDQRCAIDGGGVHDRVPYEVEQTGERWLAEQPDLLVAVANRLRDALSGGFLLRLAVAGFRLVIRNLHEHRTASFCSILIRAPEHKGPGRPGPSTSRDYNDSALALAGVRLAAALAATLAAALAATLAGAGTTSPTAAIHLLQLFRIEVTHVISFLKKKTKKISRTETLGVCTLSLRCRRCAVVSGALPPVRQNY